MHADPSAVRRRLPHTLTIIPSYGCTAACKECCFQSNPSIKHRVPQDRLLRYIDDAADLQTIRVVCFSGGEPMMLGTDLVELVERAASRGLMTRVVTNGYWATSDRAARLRLDALVAAGLNELNFSTGDDHVAYVPLERVVLGAAVGLDHGLTLALMVEERASRRVTRATVLDAAAAHPELLEAIQSGTVVVLESPWMAFAPDGAPVTQRDARLANATNVHLREPCTSVLTTIVVTPKEDLGLCCGLPREQIPDLSGGSLRLSSMGRLVRDAANDFMKIWLFVEGPERILAWAASKDPTIDWENRYAHNCDACRRVYHDEHVLGVIQQHYEEKIDEVLFKYSLFLAGGNVHRGGQ